MQLKCNGHSSSIDFFKAQDKSSRSLIVLRNLIESPRPQGDIVDSGGRGLSFFGAIDDRGASSSSPCLIQNEIGVDTELELAGGRCKLMPHVAYAAIKSGMRQKRGVAYFSDGAASFAPESAPHEKSLHTAVMHYFGSIGLR